MAALVLRKVSKTFGERIVLLDVSLELPAASVFALCGRSGSGKTTLIKIISGLVSFDSGTLHINGTSVAAGEAYPHSLYGRIGVVFQDHNLFPHLTALQNVELALLEVRQLPPKEARQRALAELERVGVAERAKQYPLTLSGGERQRVALARAVAMDPLLLLLDEPTANLEPSRVKEVHRAIQKLAEAGTTMLLATHNLDFARSTAGACGLLENGVLQTSRSLDLLNVLHADWD
ncbi:MAG TPA: ATP-binding cassette domain-containing protein [Planctomycetota bacterium]